MHSYQKNIRLLIVKIPCIIMSILILCALVIISKLQYNELSSNFDSQCKQYNTSINFLLSKFHSKAMLVTKNPNITDNLEIQNYPLIHDTLRQLCSSGYNEVQYAYIVNSQNEKLWRSHDISEQVNVAFDDILKYNETTLLYSNSDDADNGVFTLVYPISDTLGNLSGGLILCFKSELMLKCIPHGDNIPLEITIESGDSFYQQNFGNFSSLMYTMENSIALPGHNTTITLKASTFPVVKTVLSLLVLFILILILFGVVLGFYARCVNESINQPIKQMQKTIQNYTNSVMNSDKFGSENNEE